MHRILDISESPARLRIEHACLCIETTTGSRARIPVHEIAAVVLAHPQITCTQAVLAELSAAGGIVIACDAKRLPVAMQLPLQANFVQSERFVAQTRAKQPLKKQLWREIVQAKIRLQAKLLESTYATDGGLTALASTVTSGDSANVEARAARRYWQFLFPGVDFRRDREAPDQNQLLNYGYAVLRAIIARAACAVGLHLAIGLHHHNRYNACCLADDLMEPFRPAVDLVVSKLVQETRADKGFSKQARQTLLDALYARWRVGDESRSLFESAEMLASSVVNNFLGQRRKLRLPTMLELDDAVSIR